MIILVDDEHRENEGDLVMAAEFVTPDAINFMAKHGRGLICLPLTEEKIQQLQLPMMTSHNRSPYQTALRSLLKQPMVFKRVFQLPIGRIPFKWRLLKIQHQQISLARGTYFH